MSPTFARPRFIYFDLDKTLLDHTAAERAAQAETHAHFSELQALPLATWQETYHRINSGLWERYGRHEIDRSYLQRHRFEDALAALGLDTSRWQEIADHYIARYEDHWQWVEGARPAYTRIRRHYRTGILTNGFLELQRKKFDRFGFYELAEELVISEEVGYMKPQPEIFDHATRRLGLRPQDVLYVGDSLSSDIRGGRSFGWRTAWYRPNPNGEADGEADYTFREFGELLGLLVPPH